MQISGQTRCFAVLGHPIGHSLSPCMHNAALRAMGEDAFYAAFDVPPERLAVVLEAFWAMGGAGANLTIPLKEKAYEWLDALDESARLMRSVNTLVRKENGWEGHNTDGCGLLTALEEHFGQGVRGDHVFILGLGGAGRAAALACARAGAAELILADTDRARSGRVAGELAALRPDLPVRAHGGVARDADLVIQATPVGMKPGDPSPLPDTSFRKGQRVFDMIYLYPETPLLAAARRAGARTANGLGMLLHQGARALSLWTGRPAPLPVMRSALEKAVYHP